MKYFECPSCKGLLSSIDLENEHKSSNPHCKHCNMKFYEGLKFKGVSFKCGKCNVVHDDPICPQCGQNNDHPLKPNSNDNPKQSNNNSYRQGILRELERQKNNFAKGGKWKHCGIMFNTIEEFIEHFKNCSNVPSLENFSTNAWPCEKCKFIKEFSTSQGKYFEGHDCKSLKTDKNNNCSICKQPVNDYEIGNHQECLEKLSQKSSFGLKMEETKSNPKMLMAFGGGISLIVIGIIGLIISLVKLKQINKQNLEHETS